MASVQLSHLEYALKRRFEEEMRARTDALVSGAPADYAAYQYIRGQIDGIQFCLTTIFDMHERFERDGGFIEDEHE
jgi:hypothetical protein